MYPTWLTSVNDRMRLSSACATAPRTPTTIVARATTSSSMLMSEVWNSCVSVRMSAYTPTLVSRPANTAVTGAGAVGYESGSQNDSGKTAALIANASTSSRCRASCTSCGSSVIRSAMCAMFTVPSAP